MKQRAAEDVIRNNGATSAPATAPSAEPVVQPTTRPAAMPATQPATQPATRPVVLKRGELDKQLKRAVQLLREKVRPRTAQTTYDKLLLAG